MSVQPVVPVPTPPVVPVVVTPEAPQVEAKPPWGTPEEFDPAKAWELITKLREQKNDPAVAKELSELRAAKQSAEDAGRSELEKAIARAETAEKAASASAAKELRADIALTQHLTASQAKRLVGNTREELEADAIEMLADLKATTPVVPKAPGTDGQGNVGAPIAATKQITSLVGMTPQAIDAAREAGQLDDLMSGKTS